MMAAASIIDDNDHVDVETPPPPPPPTTTTTTTQPMILGTSYTFPISKQTVSNRFVKSATTESLADPNTGLPNERHCCLYNRFVGCGIIITGNVMVDRQYKESTRNVVLDHHHNNNNNNNNESNNNNINLNLEPFVKWRKSFPKESKAIMQISHPGRQCPIAVTGLSNRPVAPTDGLQSRIMLPGWLGRILGRLFVNPARGLTQEELISGDIVEKFAMTAKLAQQCGFDGVEIHAAHGYLLSQFLSPTNNLRTDEYGCNSKGRRKLLLEVIHAIRKVTSSSSSSSDNNFIVGVKINSKDSRKEGHEREDECIDLIKELCSLQLLDFIELSGGGFEDSMFVDNVKQQQVDDDGGGGDNGPFFQSIAERIQHELQNNKNNNNETTTTAAAPPPAIILTGGLRTVSKMESIVSTQKVADFIGLGRPLCLDPTFCSDVLLGGKKMKNAINFPLTFLFAKSILEPALNNLWYQRQLKLLSEGSNPNINLSIIYTLTITFIHTYVWDWKINNKRRSNR